MLTVACECVRPPARPLSLSLSRSLMTDASAALQLTGPGMNRTASPMAPSVIIILPPPIAPPPAAVTRLSAWKKLSDVVLSRPSGGRRLTLVSRPCGRSWLRSWRGRSLPQRTSTCWRRSRWAAARRKSGPESNRWASSKRRMCVCFPPRRCSVVLMNNKKRFNVFFFFQKCETNDAK